MGKYMRKSKAAGEAVSSPLGVLTRAKTLALRKLNNTTTTTAVVSPAAGNGGDGETYLQLRSRRLVKPFSVLEVKPQKHGVPIKDPNLIKPNPSKSPAVNSEEGMVKGCLDAVKMENDKEIDVCVEASFGENNLDFGRKRTTRESTPCNLIKDSDNNQTPGSSTRRIKSSESSSRILNLVQAHTPATKGLDTATKGLDEFLARAEEEMQREFMEKYNFDPVNEKPLPGRYEWVKVDC